MIARTESGKKMRIGEGSTGVVYKAFMHGDEVAVKVLRAAQPGRRELLYFKKEVRSCDTCQWQWTSSKLMHADHIVHVDLRSLLRSDIRCRSLWSRRERQHDKHA